MWTCPHCDNKTDDGFNICWTCRIPKGHNSREDHQRVIVTTTPSFESHEIVEYLWPVFGETVWGANMLRDLAAGFTDALGGRSSAYEDVLQRGRSEAINILTGHAERIGANAVVGLDIKYESVGGSMFLICASATAVRIRPKDMRSEGADPISQSNTLNQSPQ